MGQAKQRGTYEQRKAAAIERDAKNRAATREVVQRQPSPKLARSRPIPSAIMLAVAAMLSTFEGKIK